MMRRRRGKGIRHGSRIATVLVQITSRDKGAPVEGMSALMFRSTFPENLQARSAYRFPSVSPIQKMLAVQRSHPLPCGFVLDRPQAHNNGFGSSYLKRPSQAEHALSNFNFTHSRVAGRQHGPVHTC